MVKRAATNDVLSEVADEAYRRMDAMRQARYAVGFTAEQRLQWLGEFIRRDEAAVRQEQSAFELSCFVGFAPEKMAIPPDENANVQGKLRAVLDGLAPDSIIQLP